MKQLKRYGKRFVSLSLDFLARENKELQEGIALRTRQQRIRTQLANKPARVAMVGCGSQGRNLARVIAQQLEGWSLEAVHDLHTEAIEHLRSRNAPKARAFEDAAAFFEAAAQCDLLIIATTAPAHEALTQRALEHGIHKILLEKPVTTSLQSADQLAQAVDQATALVYVNHSRRWDDSVLGVQRLLRSGVIGKVQTMVFTWGPGSFAMHGTHLFDLARMLSGQDFVRMRAERDEVVQSSQRGSAFIDYSGRCEAQMSEGSRLIVDLSSSLGMRHRHFLFIGEKGRLEIDENYNTLRLLGSSGRSWELAYPYNLDFAGAAALAALQEGKAPVCSLSDGIKSLEAAIACDLSARSTGEWMNFPLAQVMREENFPYA